MLDPLQSGHDDGLVEFRSQGSGHAKKNAVRHSAAARETGRVSARRMLPRGTIVTGGRMSYPRAVARSNRMGGRGAAYSPPASAPPICTSGQMPRLASRMKSK